MLGAASQLQARLAAGESLRSANAAGYREPGWRVEFRPLEVQLTDFENAAFAVLYVPRTYSVPRHIY